MSVDYSAIKAQVMEHVDVEAEFRATFDDWKPWDNISCPMAKKNHEKGTDNSKGCQVNENGVVFCHTCRYKAMSPIDLYSDMHGVPFRTALIEFYREYVGKVVPSDCWEDPHRKLLKDKFQLKELFRRRGLTVDTAKRFKLGYDRRLTIPVLNELGLCVNVRRYDLTGREEAKIISWRKGYGSGRLFWTERAPKRFIVLCEGELDAILLAQDGFDAVTPTIGAGENKWKEEWTDALSGMDVVILPDMDRVGKNSAAERFNALSERASSVKVVELPIKPEDFKRGKKDYTDWRLDLGGTPKKFRALIDAAKGVKYEAPPMDIGGGNESRGILSKTYTTSDKLQIERSAIVMDQIVKESSFFKDGEGRLFMALLNGTVMPLSSRSSQFLSYLQSMDPIISPTNQTGKHIIQHIESVAERDSKTSRCGTLALNDGGKIYVVSKGGSIARYISGKSNPELLRNAVNDDRVLLESPTAHPLELEGKPEPQKAIDDLFNLVLSNIAVREEDRYLLACWLFGVFFINTFKVRPIVRLLAKTGAGKTSGSKLLSAFMFGEEVMTHSASTVAAIYAMSERFPIMICDNIETRNMVPAFEDFLLVASTGGSKHKRALATDRGVVRENINCLVLTNGIEPFNKREVIDRTFELAVDIQKYGKKHYHESKTLRNLQKERSAIMRGVLSAIAKYGLPRVGSGEVERIASAFPQHAKSRFNEYIGLMSIILDVLWKFRPMKKYSRPHEMVNYWLHSQSDAEIAQDTGTNEVLYFMNSFAERHELVIDRMSKVTRGADGSIEIRAMTGTLLSDFRLMAKHLGMKCPWVNERQLGTRLADSNDVLRNGGWTRRFVMVTGKRVWIYRKEALKSGRVQKRKKKKVKV